MLNINFHIGNRDSGIQVMTLKYVFSLLTELYTLESKY